MLCPENINICLWKARISTVETLDNPGGKMSTTLQGQDVAVVRGCQAHEICISETLIT